ncbi:MAG: MBOAT family protein [Prevotellaceae bacterium]|jgi:D-alanyl-lipoteichoic acid acyltransferase DltB (MBOAT superfamily)|nr:MBOAT family protein [Prevotellaceae bacterium]
MDIHSILEEIFTCDEGSALIFTRLSFWIFFAALLVGYSFIYKKKYKKTHLAKSLYLLLFSLFFYYKSSGIYFLLLLFSTTLDFYLAKAIYRSHRNAARKLLVALSVCVNLGLLAYFKYAYFLTSAVNDFLGEEAFRVVNIFSEAVNMLTGAQKFDVDNLILPIGISFYTFQILSYTVDVYRRKVAPVNSIIDFGFYVSFFPSLVAGPIVRAADFIPQIYREYSVTRREAWQAVFLILNGLVKKVAISDYISLNFVDRVFDTPSLYSGFELLMGVYGYAIQIYCDFSGYTDIAIGLALLLGFRLPPNFNSPYRAASLREFWQRWHISLSSWLRDYLYIPLGGNRKGRARTYINLILTMLLGGLWHGASYKFVVWGGLHGVALALGKLVKERRAKAPRRKFKLPAFVPILLTFHFVCLTWIFFRAADMSLALDIIYRIGAEFYLSAIPDIVAGYSLIFGLMLAAYAIHFLPQKVKVWYREMFINLPDAVKIVVALLVVFFIYQASSSEMQPFIYFQF